MFRVHRKTGIYPVIFFMENNLSRKILSVFIDESGDIGPYDYHSPNYYVTLLFHEQDVDISKNIAALDDHLRNYGLEKTVLHAGPLIRREQIYKYEKMEIRKGLFNSLFHFIRGVPIKYICPKINKSECKDMDIDFFTKLSKAISDELKRNFEYLNSFDLQIIYYDYGQKELSKIITLIFTTLFSNVEFRKVEPADYKLFQAADLICTMEMTKDKADKKEFSKSELEFFHSPHDFNKNLYKQLIKKKL